MMCGSVSGVFCEGVGAAGMMSKALFTHMTLIRIGNNDIV